ncbi:uncharacterized protein TNCV_32431 [Trichonephila clavipes]|nr:uncharacterized protein TNCV_32431 [Trichonephila clavipes]
MQDGAPPHITRCVTDVLKHHFTEERVISRQFRHLWPRRSPDLNPCDFWLWGHLKQLVSCDPPKTLPDLKDSISRHALNISQNTLRSTVEHAILRFQIVAENDEKLTVWCALWAGGIIGPYFFKNDEGHNVKVNGDRYRAMITNFFIPELTNHDVQELWFQQDGVTCHTARATIDLLKDTFGDRLISRFGPVNWPSRSCDLTSLDYFL